MARHQHINVGFPCDEIPVQGELRVSMDVVMTDGEEVSYNGSILYIRCCREATLLQKVST